MIRGGVGVLPLPFLSPELIGFKINGSKSQGVRRWVLVEIEDQH